MSIKAAVNPRVLERLCAWGRAAVDFEEHHALDGLFVAEGWQGRSGRLGEDDLFLLALTITFTFWVDDRSDRYIDRDNPMLDWEALIENVETARRPARGSPPEIDVFERLSDLLGSRAKHPEEHALWRTATARMLRAMHFEEQAARGLRTPSFAECVEVGALSTGVEMILTGAYLVHEVNRPARAAGAWPSQMERYMCIYQRLLNDLHSAEKERGERSAGRVANAVLLMESDLPPAAARRFVEEQCEAYRRMTDECFARLGPGDVCVTLIREMREQVDRWYRRNPERYGT